MTKDGTTKGFWWCPATPGRKSFGILDWEGSSRAALTVYAERGDDNLATVPAGATIHGADEQGKPVTLLLTTRRSTSSPAGVSTIQIDPGYILIGAHVTDKSSFTAKTMTLKLQHLYGWLGLSGFSRKIGCDIKSGYDISYRHPKSADFMISADTTISFGMATNFSAGYQAQTVSEEADVSFGRKGGMTFKDCWNLTHAVRSLLHFSILKRIAPVEMSLDGVTETEGTEGNTRSGVKVWASLFGEQKTEAPVDYGQWVFRFDDVKGDFGQFFAKWLEYEAQYSEALKCYSTTIYHPLPSPVANLCLAQALDAYHGVRFSSHGKRNFEGKIKELCALHSEALSGLVADIPAFATKVRDTRDYYTHHNPADLSSRGVVQGASDLIRLNEIITILFQACVLSDNGIPANRFSRLRRQMASEIVEF